MFKYEDICGKSPHKHGYSTTIERVRFCRYRCNEQYNTYKWIMIRSFAKQYNYTYVMPFNHKSRLFYEMFCSLLRTM